MPVNGMTVGVAVAFWAYVMVTLAVMEVSAPEAVDVAIVSGMVA